jgi:hypothetical protein
MGGLADELMVPQDLDGLHESLFLHTFPFCSW